MTLELWIDQGTYDRLISLCDPRTEEYRSLKNGFIEPDEQGGKRICLFCKDQHYAKELLNFSIKTLPDCGTAMQQVWRTEA